MNKRLYETLVERGYIYQTTNDEQVKNILNGESSCFYVGIDPTADGLHIGHCLPIIMAKHMQEAGHKIIIVLGGATAMIGDPSGKSDMRQMVTDDFIAKNRPFIERDLSKFIKLDGDNPAILVNNADWFKGYEYIEFMRDIGVHFNVNKMLACDAYKNRLASGGLTFFEMGYMLMQAYDFVYLNRHYNCRVEFGGSDQWANILAGAELGRKLAIAEGKDAETFQAFTNVLLLNADGVKMGKTVSGAVWVDKVKMSSYEFYQYFYNIDDRDVEKFLKLLTYLSLDEIEEIMKGDIRIAKKRFAYAITSLTRGVEEADNTQSMAQSLFNGGGNDAPVINVKPEDISILDAIVLANMAKSKGEARRLIMQGGISIDAVKVEDALLIISKTQIEAGILIKKGKKQFVKIISE